MLALRGGLSVDALGWEELLPLLGVQLGVQLVAVSGACVPAEAPPAATPAVAQRSITTWWVAGGHGGWAPHLSCAYMHIWVVGRQGGAWSNASRSR